MMDIVSVKSLNVTAGEQMSVGLVDVISSSCLKGSSLSPTDFH